MKGGEFLGLARKRVLQLSCNQVDGLAAFTVLDNSSLTSFASIQSAPTLTTITNAQGPQNASSISSFILVGIWLTWIHVVGAGSATTFGSVLPNLTIILLPDVSDAEIVAALRNGTIDVMIDIDTTTLAEEGIDVTGLRTFFGGFDSPAVSLFAIICKNEE